MEVKPGYKQTEVGVIPEDWIQITIRDIATKVGSGVTPTGGSARYKEYGRPFVRSQNVGWGRLLLDDLVFIDDETHNGFPATELKRFDVLLNITGASIGRTALADKKLVGGNVNQHVCIIRIDANDAIPTFINLLLLSALGQRQIENFQAGGNRQGLNFAQISSIIFHLPPTLHEQRAIAEALSDADALIESLKQLIDKKRHIKQGAMQELLTGKKRLPGFGIDKGYKQTEEGEIPVDWEVTDLGRICAQVTTGKLDANAMKPNGQYRFYTCAKDYCQIDTYAFDTEALLISGNGANVGYIHYYNGKFNAYQRTYVLSGFSELISYIQHLMGQKFADRIRIEVNAGNTPYITRSTITEMKVALPPTKAEQEAIAAILSDMDTEIAALEAKLGIARQIKQGMMHELLTGRIRLIRDKNAEARAL
jgi:type I restriction enzyme, S subunit